MECHIGLPEKNLHNPKLRNLNIYYSKYRHVQYNPFHPNYQLTGWAYIANNTKDPPLTYYL